MIEKVTQLVFKSLTKEVAPYLLRRNIQESKLHPGKFHFANDGRLKYHLLMTIPQQISIELAKQLNMPYLYLRAAKNHVYDHYFHPYQVEITEIVDILKKSNSKFEYHVIDSSHHMHLTEPEKISSIVSQFIEKNRAIGSKL